MIRAFTRLIARIATRTRTPRQLVAIVIPLSHRPRLTPDEQVSLRHLQYHLPNYDKFLLLPPGSPLAIPGCTAKIFPARFFGSAAAHNLLMYSPALYRAFSDYRYIFFYHLDALVFSDELERWCTSGLDYIGPPWIRCADTPWISRPRVGNGGFTLLNVGSALRALRGKYDRDPLSFWIDLFTRQGTRVEPIVNRLRSFPARFPGRRILQRFVDDWEQMRDPSPHNRNNDVFWSDKAARYHPGFRVASLEQGLQFAFEASPRTCWELAGRRMPFGCHAWARYDRSFWEPHLLPETSAVNKNYHAAVPV